MTRFGEWLGKENGKEMLASVFTDYSCTEEQARAAITTYCVLFDINVDTSEWDELMKYMYEYYNLWFDTFEEFDGFMCGLLI